MMQTTSQATVETNSAWFADNDSYIENQSKLECYRNIKLEEFTWIPRGRWVLQFGIVWPTLLTPVVPVKLVLRRPHATGGIA